MADASSITVNIDAAIHAQLHDLLQGWAEDHGVRVTEIDIDWAVARSVSGRIDAQHVRYLRVVTESL